MIITVIDDEALALRSTADAVRTALPEAEIHTFMKSSELLSFAEEKNIDIAFLDINMRGITGLEVAEKLKKITPRVNIIFVTGYDEYKGSAMDLKASGYLMKPVVADDILREFNDLRYPVRQQKPVTAKCFGNFSVQLNGAPAHFAYKKTEELLAYLIDRKGATITYGELSAILWEDDSHIHYLKKLRADLLDVFEKAGLPDVILSRKGSLSIDLSKISCDYIDYLNHVPGSENAFHGEYMSQYSWAENTLGALSTQ